MHMSTRHCLAIRYIKIFGWVRRRLIRSHFVQPAVQLLPYFGFWNNGENHSSTFLSSHIHLSDTSSFSSSRRRILTDDCRYATTAAATASYLSFFTLTYFEAWKFYTQKCVNLQQKLSRDNSVNHHIKAKFHIYFSVLIFVCKLHTVCVKLGTLSKTTHCM